MTMTYFSIYFGLLKSDCFLKVQKGSWNFDKDCFEPVYISLGNIPVLTLLSLSIHKHRISFHLFRSYLISFNDVLQFSVYKSNVHQLKKMLCNGVLFVNKMEWSCLICAWWTFKTCQVKEAKHKDHIFFLFHLYEMARISKSIDRKIY